MLRWSMIVVVMVSVAVSGGRGANTDTKKLDRPAEIVLVLDGSKSVKNNDYSSMINTVRQFPDLVQMGEQHVRVAVVVFSTLTKIEVELTADEQKVRNLPDKRDENGGTRTHKALEQVKEAIFAKARPDAMRVVILITDGMPSVGRVPSVDNPDNFEYDTGPTEAAAKKLRDANAVMFAAFVGNVNETVRKHLENVTNDPQHVMPVGKFPDLAAVVRDRIKTAIECHYEEFCFFDAQKQCKWDSRRPDTTELCTNDPPKKDPHCEAKMCVATCEQWRWNAPKCDESNVGQSVKIERESKRPDGNKFEFCEESATVTCPTAAISTTIEPTGGTTSAKSMGSSAASDQPQKSTTSVGVGPVEPGGRPSAGEWSETTKTEGIGESETRANGESTKTTGVSGSSKSVTGGPGDGQSQGPAGKVEGGDSGKGQGPGGDGSRDDKDNDSNVMIFAIVGAIVGVLLLAIIIVAVIVSHRRKNRAAAAKKGKEDRAKMAAAIADSEKKRIAVEKAAAGAKERSSSSKKGASLSATTSMGVSASGSGRAKDDSMQVSLADRTNRATVRSAKTAKSSNAAVKIGPVKAMPSKKNAPVARKSVSNKSSARKSAPKSVSKKPAVSKKPVLEKKSKSKSLANK